ncbi:MAG: hypothetical protein ACLFWD_07800 [Anaerolineales bacterium]
MGEGITRRDAIKLGALSAGALAFSPPIDNPAEEPFALGRVTVDWIGLYSEPSFRANRITRLTRDSLVTLRQHVHSDDGPSHNPLWHELPDGYAHSGHLQLVKWRPQEPIQRIPSEGALFEVSVPFTRSYREPDPHSDPLYRLYYQSTAWVEDCVVGADGRLWY